MPYPALPRAAGERDRKGNDHAGGVRYNLVAQCPSPARWQAITRVHEVCVRQASGDPLPRQVPPGHRTHSGRRARLGKPRANNSTAVASGAMRDRERRARRTTAILLSRMHGTLAALSRPTPVSRGSRQRLGPS